MRNKRKVKQLKKKRKRDRRDERRKVQMAPPPPLRALPAGNALIGEPVGEPIGPKTKPSSQLMSAFAEELEQRRGDEGKKTFGKTSGPKRPAECLDEAPCFEIPPTALILAVFLIVMGVLVGITRMLPW